MTIKEEIEAAGWPEIYIRNVFYDKNILSFSMHELKKNRLTFRYETKTFLIEGLSYLSLTLREGSEGDEFGFGDVVFHEDLGDDEVSCDKVPGLRAVVKGNPFDDTQKTAFFCLEFIFEADSLDVEKTGESVTFSLKTDVTSMPDFKSCPELLGYFKENLRARGSRLKGSKTKLAATTSEIVDILTKHDLISPSKLPIGTLTATHFRELIIEHNKYDILGVFPEDIGTENDADKDYVEILGAFQSHSKNGIRLKNISSQYRNSGVFISFVFNGKRHKWEFDQYSDHISGEFFDKFFMLQDEFKLGKFVELKGGDIPEFVYVPLDAYDILVSNDLVCSN